jgi:glycosyltransferase involved in cell wall biosynthesis
VNTTSQAVWLLVAGGFHQRGGMDKANYALAEYLSETGRPVHLVSHDVDPTLQAMPGVEVTLVKRPFESVFLGEYVLDRAARSVQRRLRSNGNAVRILANGSSCLVGDVNWVHYVHSAWVPSVAGDAPALRLRTRLQWDTLCWRERRAFRRAKLILTNSHLTSGHVSACLADNQGKVSTIYLGADPLLPIAAAERAAARRRWNISLKVPVAAFVGSFGMDSRKGFDIVLASWESLCRRTDWDAQLLVAGDGPALARFRRQAETSPVAASIRFLGFSNEVESVLAASDVLISPVRYEPYGLNVQEALSRGLPVLTSASAGIAERFSGELASLLIRDPENIEECVDKILRWRADTTGWSQQFRRLGDQLRQRTWHAMAQDIVHFVDAALLRDGV